MPETHVIGFHDTGNNLNEEDVSYDMIARNSVSPMENDAAPLDPTAQGTGDSCCMRLCSAQAAIVLLCLCAIAAVAGVTTGILSNLVDSSVADTRDSCRASVGSLGTTCVGSVEEVATFLLGFASASIEKAIFVYLEKGFESLAFLQSVAETQFPDMEKTSMAFRDAAAPILLNHARAFTMQQSLMGTASPVQLAGLYAGGTGMVYIAAGALRCSEMNFTQTPMVQFGTPHPQTGRLDMTGLVFSAPQAMEDLPGLSIARSQYIPVGTPKFAQVEAFDYFLGYPLVMPLNTPGGTVQAVVNVGLELIEAFLKKLGDFTGLGTDMPSPLVFTLIRSSWLALEAKKAGEKNWADWDQSYILTGTSKGNSIRREEVNLPGAGRRIQNIPLRAVEAGDPTIRALAKHYDGRYDEFGGKLAQRVDLVVESGNSTNSTAMYASVSRLHNDAWGIDWWMVVALDEEAIMRGVREAMEKTHEDIQAKDQEVRDEVSSSLFQALVITVGVSVVVLVLSVVLSHSIMAPIKAVQQAMNRVANMDLKNTKVASFSRLYEARQMQRDFAAMVDCLEEYRAYVPSSLLNSDNGSVAKCVEPPTGNIAIVFTDIQGSTNLWKRSAEDMNVALEKHNELIRAACARHGGYEVKTIGDSFMISLQSPVAAAQLALDIQKAFAEEEWPERLELPGAGMVVRIGVNYGSTISESNPVTGRVDYRGSTVNMASRLEGKAMPGTTCISSDMYAALQGKTELGTVMFQEFGTHELKGLGEGHKLYLMVPLEQSKRLSARTSDCFDKMSAKASTASDDAHSISSASTVQRRRNDVRKLHAGKTGLQISRTQLTVAVCKLVGDSMDSDVFDNCNTMVLVASDTATATEGVIGSVTGNTISVLWNASKKCRMHTIAGLSFAAQVQTRTQRVMRVGVATGSMLYGNVGTQKNRFATTFGTTFDAAEAVADLALRLHTFSMFADCTGGPRSAVDVSAESCLRLIDLWYDVAEKKPLRVYQLDCRLMRQKVGMWEEDDQKDVQRSRHQYTSITAFCNNPEDRTPLDELQHMADEEQDTVLRVMLGAFADSRPMDGCRCAVRFDRVPAGARISLLPPRSD